MDYNYLTNEGEIMIKWFILSLIIVSQAGAVMTDEDGCWNTSGMNCISASAKWSQYEKDLLIVTYRNTCDARVYIKMCNSRKDGSKDCGSEGIFPGQTATWSTHNANGRYNWKTVGSTRSSSDWECSGKVNNWNND